MRIHFTIDLGEMYMPLFQDIQAKLERLNLSFQGVKADIAAIKAKIEGSHMTEEETAAVLADLESLAQKFEGLDAENESTPG